MIYIYNKISSISLGDSYILLFQIICLIFLTYYLIKSLVILFYDIRIDKSCTSKGFPALAIVYTLLSVLFILVYISSFDEILKIFDDGYTDIYKARAGCESFQDNELTFTEFKCLENYRIAIRFTLLSILTLLAVNFSKAFYTLNSLELNKIATKPLNEILENKIVRIRFERTTRLLIAFFFIIIEKSFFEMNLYKNNSDLLIDLSKLKEIILEFSFLIFLLYFLLVVWIFKITCFLKGNNDFKTFSKQTPFQLLCGLGISFIFFIISILTVNNLFNWSFWVFIISGLSVFLFIMFIKSVLIIEFSYLTTVLPKIIKK
jgi:hypothetical protein